MFSAPGLSPNERTAEWLWDHHVVAVASDTPALEAMPFDKDSVDRFLHYRLVTFLGLAVGELFALDTLAADCATTGVRDGLFVAAPLNMPGGAGSPANAIAIK
jgi:kynurenine formamidase